MSDSFPGPADLAPLEEEIRRALESGDDTGLDVLGYGEISSVVAYSWADRRWACKRLPPFDGEARLEAYRSCFEAYLARLAACGVEPVESRIVAVPDGSGSFSAYCVQPVLDPAGLGSRHLRDLDEAGGTRFVEEVLDRVLRAVSPSLGLDSQLSNWVATGEGLRYLDVTTPMMRDDEGRELLDTELFMASLPWALRPVVRRFLIQGILDTYFRPRNVVRDLLANLHKERLGEWIPVLLPVANRGSYPPITEDEILRYYREDARTYVLLQRLRRLDRAWQRSVRRRPYPFLLPGAIDRAL